MSKPTFNILGDIVANDADRWFVSDIVPGMVIGWLDKQTGDVEININSNGGDVAAGLAIANAIKGYSKGDVTCNVLGVAASMASVVACAGKSLTMGQGAFLMVHNPWTVTMGNADDLRKDAETLDKMRDSILGFYQSKTGKSADDLKALMDAETWITRDEARDLGFDVQDYSGELKAAASLTRRAFDKAPDAAKALFTIQDKRPDAAAPAAAGGPGSVPAAADNWEARYKGLSAKYNDLQKRGIAAVAEAESRLKGEIAARDAQIEDLKSQLDTSRKDLEDAKAKLTSANGEIEQLRGKVEEQTQALQKATGDLAQTRDSLKAAEDKAAKLESTRDLLTAGVLTPPDAGTSYAEQMKAAKTPEEREALRAKKRAGKIK